MISETRLFFQSLSDARQDFSQVPESMKIGHQTVQMIFSNEGVEEKHSISIGNTITHNFTGNTVSFKKYIKLIQKQRLSSGLQDSD